MSAERIARLRHDFISAVACYFPESAECPVLLFVKEVEPGHWPRGARLQCRAGCHWRSYNLERMLKGRLLHNLNGTVSTNWQVRGRWMCRW